MTKKFDITFDKSDGAPPLLAQMADRLDEELRGLGFTVTDETQSRTGKSVARFVSRRRPSPPPDDTNDDAPRDPSPTAAALLDYVVANNWVCPQHAPWTQMWKILPEIDGKKPAGPVPLVAWPHWDFLIRREFLIRHVICADERGVIDQIDQVLRGLWPDEWVSMS